MKKTRFKIAVCLMVFLGCIVVYSIQQELTEVTGNALTGLMTVLQKVVMLEREVILIMYKSV